MNTNIDDNLYHQIESGLNNHMNNMNDDLLVTGRVYDSDIPGNTGDPVLDALDLTFDTRKSRPRINNVYSRNYNGNYNNNDYDHTYNAEYNTKYNSNRNPDNTNYNTNYIPDNNPNYNQNNNPNYNQNNNPNYNTNYIPSNNPNYNTNYIPSNNPNYNTNYIPDNNPNYNTNYIPNNNPNYNTNYVPNNNTNYNFKHIQGNNTKHNTKKKARHYVNIQNEPMDQQSFQHGTAPDISREEYIRRAREACQRQLSGTAKKAERPPINYNNSMQNTNMLYNNNPDTMRTPNRENRLKSFLAGVHQEEDDEKEAAAFRALIIRTISAVVIFFIVYLIDKNNIKLGGFSSEVIKKYVTGNDRFKELENLIMTLLKH
jgi:hypothetical protein